VKSDEIRPRDGDRGRTIYWGSTTSRVMVRVYEAGKMRDRLHFGRPDWARAEAQIRPGKAMEKVAAAQVSPLEAWGFAAWSMRAAEALSQFEVPRFAPAVTPATFDRTTVYLARAFRRHWESMLEDFGDWECIGREMAAVWAADDQAEEATRAALKR
jgi:DNA relaxase NicK